MVGRILWSVTLVVPHSLLTASRRKEEAEAETTGKKRKAKPVGAVLTPVDLLTYQTSEQQADQPCAVQQ